LRIARCFRFGFDTFEHAIALTCCTATNRQGLSLRQTACGMSAMPSHRREDVNHSGGERHNRSGEAGELFGARPGRIADLYPLSRFLGGQA
jgi:hypothetical protein